MVKKSAFLNAINLCMLQKENWNALKVLHVKRIIPGIINTWAIKIANCILNGLMGNKNGKCKYLLEATEKKRNKNVASIQALL